MSTFNNDAFLAAQKTAVDTLLSVVNTALASAERVAALNLHATREAFEDMASNGKAVLSVKSPQDAMALPASMAQPHIEKGVAYTRSVYEITSAAREDATAIVEGKFEEFKKSMATLADKIATTSPVGSEVAIADLSVAIATSEPTGVVVAILSAKVAMLFLKSSNLPSTMAVASSRAAVVIS